MSTLFLQLILAPSKDDPVPSTEPLYIRAEAITSVRRDKGGTRTFIVVGASSYAVRETPEQIFELINKVEEAIAQVERLMALPPMMEQPTPIKRK